MLRVHHSNRMETLVEVLDHLVRQASAPPLAAETIVVPHRSMAHWLSLQLANRCQPALPVFGQPHLGTGGST